MLVYKFDKTFLQRLEEFKIILEDQDGVNIRDCFKEFLETSIEPAGYFAIWRLTRSDCEKFEICFPCEVYGEVIDTDFDLMDVSFKVLSVQDENIHLPEIVNVRLEDIYTTVDQDNKAMKERFDLTADCLDRFRFFFNFVFLPFDDEEDKDFLKKHLLPRLTLFYDLKNKKISKGTASRVRKLIMEAKYIETKKMNLEDSFTTDDELDISCGEPKETARKLLELHLRMSQIKNEIEILANPDMRDIYEELKFPNIKKQKFDDGEKKVFTVAKVGTLNEQMQVLESLKSKVNGDAKVQWLTLSEAIAAALNPKSEIYIPSGEYSMSFYEFLNGDVLLAGLPLLKPTQIDREDETKYAKLMSNEPGSMLFAIDGDIRLQDLIIDCKNVKTGFLIKNGKITIKNCLIYGSRDSSIAEAFNVSGDTKVLIENSVISNFSTGIFISNEAKVNLRNVLIENCRSGIAIQDDAMISLEHSTFTNCTDSSIVRYSSKITMNKQVLNPKDKTECGTHHIYLLGDANTFSGNKMGEVILTKKLSENTVYENEETFEEMDSSMINELC